MAITAIPLITRMTLRFVTGLDENMNPILRNRSWSNIKTGASNENVHAVAAGLASLCTHTLSSVRRLNENELEEE